MVEAPGNRRAPALSRLRNGARRRSRDVRRWAFRAWLDLQDRRNGTRDPLLPPRRLGLPVPAPVLGERIVALLKDDGGLDRSSDVLDIGCGPGRIAAPLARWLGPSGSYEGFDVMPKSIAWCEKTITPRYPNFRFRVADVVNGEYNPRGSQRASEYVFPFGDGSFDVALATSLFTHLKPFESERYLTETARTLRPGGRLVGTWFLLDDRVEAALEEGILQPPGMFSERRPPLRLEHRLTDERGNSFRTSNAETPEYMIALAETEVRAMHEKAGLEVVLVRRGSWAGGGEKLGQDVVVAERRPA
jgi:SAM-dependent methyltransferase